MGALLAFYVPLSLTSVLTLATSPLGSAAMSRMPAPLPSLAVWPVFTGLTFMMRSFGLAFNEVVVALLDRPRSVAALRRFTLQLSVATSVVMLLFLLPPVSRLWFQGLIGLSPQLALMAERSLWLALPLPALAVVQSWYTGAILHGRRTGAVTEAVALSLAAAGVLLVVGVAWGGAAGLYVAAAAFTVGDLLRTLWLWWRSRDVRRRLGDREREGAGPGIRVAA